MVKSAGRLVALLSILAGTLAWGQANRRIESDEGRTKFNFNSAWKLHVGDVTGANAANFPDNDWPTVTLPHAWNEDDAFRVSIRDLPTGIAWYRKYFVLPQAATGQKVFLEFEGIRQAGDFYLNGQFIGRSENGVMAFGFDITNTVKPAPALNVLAARIDNSWNYHEQATRSTFEWNDRNFYANYGGINKNVYLHITGRLYQTLPLFSNLGTTGVYVYTDHFDVPAATARITAQSQVKNETDRAQQFSYESIVRDAEGKTVAILHGDSTTIAPGQVVNASASGPAGNLHFWSWGYGYLYDVETRLIVDGRVVDSVHTRTGLRKTEFDHGQLKLNDRTLQIKGYAQRTTNEWPALGNCVPEWVSDFSNQLIVQDNGNLVRWMHVTPWKQDVESLDRLGIMESMPAGDSERDVQGRRWDQRLELMRDAIIYNRNNPSIIFYECGNKGISELHMQQMLAIRDQYDPHGGRAMGAREMLNSKLAEYGGEMLYINKSAGKPLWAMEYCRDEGARKYWDEFTPPFHSVSPKSVFVKPAEGQKQEELPEAFEYNRNQDSFALEDVTRWYDYWHERPGTGERVNAGGVNIIFSDSNTHYRGINNYRRSGEVDAMRLPKDAYFAHQIVWSGWVNIEKPTAYILGHWNYAAGTRKNIYVISSADKVELLINGRSLGYGEQSARFIFTFKDVLWQPGELRAVGLNASGEKVCEATKITAGQPVKLRLTPHISPHGLLADGADLALVDVEVIDNQNHRCPTAMNDIKFSLAGPAEWRGGIAQGPNNYILSKTLPVECGINRVILRALATSGKIELTATANGLTPAKIELQSKPVIVANGLSTDLSGENLPTYLQRGPTPPGDSAPPTRQTIHIARATAGSNPQEAIRSFDDDETTSWHSIGRIENAWIQYDLAKPAPMNEVTLKMGAFRTRSYPIAIKVNGKEVYRGSTPRSLGYVTLPFPAALGSSLRIELIGKPTDGGDFNLTEVADQKNLYVTGQPPKSGALQIIEAEIYGPLK
ncbi:MAG TPA: DUF4982 domain-containing protein [Tepidisphaeraceae bacterium]|jgi:beta-galactosidase/beta-glucuronidase